MSIVQAFQGKKQADRGEPVRLNGRIVGYVVGSEFRRTLAERHVLRLPRPAIAASEAVLAAAEGLGATIGVWTLPDGRAAVLGLQEFRRLAVLVDRGHGPQLAVPIALMFAAHISAEPTVEQLQLFEVLT